MNNLTIELYYNNVPYNPTSNFFSKDAIEQIIDEVERTHIGYVEIMNKKGITTRVNLDNPGDKSFNIAYYDNLGQPLTHLT
jgi:hypothetical protein